MIEDAGVRVIGVDKWSAGPKKKHFVRKNFLAAVRKFLAEGG